MTLSPPSSQQSSFNVQRMLFFASAYLLCIPLLFWIFSYQWQITNSYFYFDFFLFLITESGSAPIYAVITSILFTGLLLKQYGKNNQWKLIIILIIISIQGASQIEKTILKLTFKEARPYVNQLIQDPNFYTKNRSQRALIVQENVNNYPHIPTWLGHHWQAETGYSFPSGHTAFAAGWFMIFIIFLKLQKSKPNILLTTIIGTWAGLMLISRAKLGMHFPIDLFVGVIITYASSAFIYFATSKYTHIKNRKYLKSIAI